SVFRSTVPSNVPSLFQSFRPAKNQRLPFANSVAFGEPPTSRTTSIVPAAVPSVIHSWLPMKNIVGPPASTKDEPDATFSATAGEPAAAGVAHSELPMLAKIRSPATLTLEGLLGNRPASSVAGPVPSAVPSLVQSSVP